MQTDLNCDNNVEKMVFLRISPPVIVGGLISIKENHYLYVIFPTPGVCRTW
jgi:hypothetical protein